MLRENARIIKRRCVVMITVTKINDRDIVVNCDLIELIESTPDTTLTTTTGRKIIVLDTVDEILKKVVEYKGRINKVKID
jgi:flagellar protein FlbD